MKQILQKIKQYSLVLLLVLMGNYGWGQIAQWPLTSDGNSTNVNANISASAFSKGTGVSAITYNTAGAYANNWSTGGIDLNDYFEISISPSATYSINVSNLNFSERRSSTGIRNYQVRWSIDNFSNFTTIATVGVPDDDLERSGNISGLNINVASGQTLKFRFYGYNSEAAGGTWRINDGTLNIVGTVNALNVAPTATSVSFSGTTNVGQTLTGSYTYTDADGNPQGTSTFQWYRADNASGSNSAAISGANATTYTLQAADNGKYIRFGVVPVAQTGTSPGIEAFSSWQGPVTDPTAVTATLTPSVALTEQNLNGEILTLTLENTTFTDATLDAANFALNNAPSGVSISGVSYTNATTAQITLAYNDTDFDTSIANFSVTTASNELSAAQNLTSSSISITAVTETLSVSTITSFGSTCLNSETTKTFTVSGTNLKVGNVSLASLSGFTYSLDNTTFTPTLTIASAGGTLAATTIHVKFVPTAVQSYDGNIVVSGVGAPSQNRSVVASGVNTTPTITTPTSTSITASSAVLGGNVTVVGCNNITERGIYYSTVSNFVDGTGTKVSETSGSYSTGTFTVNVTGLTSGTTYYYKAFATSASGTSYTTSYGTFSTLKIEPANHPINFVATGVTTEAIVPQWTASLAGAQAPDGYLIKASTTTVADPVDGTDPANSTIFSSGSANRKVTLGTATSGATFTGMSSGTMYNYKIYPYTNTGTSIDFKITDAPSFSHATLPTAPTSPTVSNLQPNTASLSWTLGTHNAGNKVLVFVKEGSAITTGSPTTAPVIYSANTFFGSGTAYQNDSAAFCVYKGDSNTVAISGLLANTTYHVVIYRAVEATNSNGTNSYSAVLTTSFATLTNPVTLPYTQNFETTTSEWVLDTSGTNKWAIGPATNNGGTKALYISNDSGTTNNYSTTTAQTGTNASVRVDLTGLTAATLSFDWKSNGEIVSETVYDYGEVYINKGGSDVLISGNKEFNSTTTFATKTIDISEYVGGIVTLKFRWVNNSSGGNQPPFAVDNVNIVPYGIPNFTTTAITNITYNSADSGGTITTDGGSAITARGIVYATTPNPTLSNAVISNGAGNGSYTANLTGLLSNTTYYVRAFVTNSNGTYYANEVSFTTTNIPAPVATAATNISSSGFTANWNAVVGANTYLLDVFTISKSPQEVLNQNFNTFTSTGGNDGSWSGSIAGTSLAASDLANWTITSGYKADKCVRIGTSSVQGSLQTPALGLSGNAVLTFRAGAWSGDSTQLNLEITGGGSLEMSSVTMLNAAFNSFTVGITGGTANTKITFKGKQASNSRFFLDDVKVVNSAVETPITNSPFSVTAPTIFKDVTGLTPSTTYYYRVRAINGSTSSANSNEIQVTTRPDTTIWDGNAWSDGAPLSDIDAFIDGDYDGSSFESKTITVNTGKTLTVNSFVKTGNVTNNGNIIVANGANFLQVGSFYSGDGASFKVRKDTKAVKRLAYMNWSSPMADSSQTLKQFSYGKNANGTAQSSTGTLDNRFYTYDKNAYVLTAPSGTFTKGQGYLIRTPNDFTTTPQIFHAQFEGTIPNAGNITYDHSSLQGNFILLGNPYPSAISYDDFITKNSNTNQTIYMWNSQVEMTNNQYTGTLYNSYNKAGANPANSFDGYIPVGQGFFVERTNNTPFVFTDSMRRTSKSGMMSKSANVSKDRFWLEMTSPSGAKPQLLIGFFPTATSGIDQGFDATVLDASTNVLYTTVEDKKLNIDAHGSFDEGDEFSLSANLTENGTYSIGILQKEGIFNAGQKVYLKDQLTGSITDLTTGQYEFTDTIGLKNNRFSIVFKPSGVLDTQSVTKEEVKIVSVGKEVRVKAEQNIVAVEIYDLSGKKLAVAKPNQRQASLTLLAQGIVIVKVTLQNNVEKSKKVILK